MKKISLRPENVTDGLAQLVLTLVETLRQLMEKQAKRRMLEGSLTDEEIERLGLTFMKLKAKIREIATVFNLSEKDLGLDLGPLGDLVNPEENRSDIPTLTLVDLLDRVIAKGVIVFGDLGISVADVELITIQLRLLVSSIKRAPIIRKERPATVSRKRAKVQTWQPPEVSIGKPRQELLAVVTQRRS